MLDIKFVRNNPEVVKQNIKNKFQDDKLPLVDEVIELDQRNREIKQEVEALRACLLYTSSIRNFGLNPIRRSFPSLEIIISSFMDPI